VVTCPFCKEKAVVDISFSLKKTETVLYRGVEKSAKEDEPLPDILLTRKP
jgi:sarcosine oxidase delta subunit